ncbi:MAG: hypothetical protein V1726_08250 [Methanobacteriota archaeon]
MKSTTRFIVGIVFFILCVGCFSGLVSAADRDLADQYAPVLYFEGGEECYPVDVSYSVENSYLYQVGVEMIVSMSPSLDTLGMYTESGYYLDNQLGSIADNGIIDDYQSKMSTLGYTVYAHVDSANNVIQYWFFYAFNKGDLNQHEGDWEMVQIALTNGQPSEVMYSQHHSGQKASWNQVERDGDHIKVYVARGSHANYLRSYSGKIGLASDTVGANGKILKPADYDLKLLESQSWLDYGGHWGWVGGEEAASVEASILGQAGPEGPKFREGGNMWSNPLGWGADLLPANDTLFILEWLVYNFVLLFVLVTVLVLLLILFGVYRRSKRYGLGPRYCSLLYIDGGNLKSIGNILCLVGIVVAVIGLFLPWYGVSTNIAIPDYQTTGTVDMIKIDGLSGVQITLPNSQGPIPLGSFALPFSLFIAISLVFLVLASVGVAESKKLGRKYMSRGIRLIIPFIIVVIVVMMLGMIVPTLSPVDMGGNTQVNDAVNMIAGSPFGGEETISITDVPGGQVYLRWGFGLGLYLLFFAGILLVIAGVLESSAKTMFFQPKKSEVSKEKKEKKAPKEPVEPTQAGVETSEEDKTK